MVQKPGQLLQDGKNTARTRPPPSGLCRSWLVLVECLDYCKTLHSQALRNAQVLEVAGLVSCRVRDRERKTAQIARVLVLGAFMAGEVKP